MGKLWRIEWYRAVINHYFYICLLGGLGIFLYGIFVHYEWYQTPYAFTGWLWGYELFVIFAPLLAVLPHASSMVEDFQQHFSVQLLTRVSQTSYIWTKTIVNAVVGGVSCSLPVLVAYGIGSLVYTPGAIAENSILAGAFGQLPQDSPLAYVFVCAGIAFFFGVAFATLGLSLSTFLHNIYYVLATPFLLYWVVNFILHNLELGVWAPSTTLGFFSMKDTTLSTMLLPLVMILLVGLSILTFQSMRREV